MAGFMHDALGALVGCLAAGAGALELQGVKELRRGQGKGVRWLIASQLAVLVVIVGYALYRQSHFDEHAWRRWLRPEILEYFLPSGRIRPDELMPLIKFMHVVTYGTVAIATIFFQGGMAWYYHRRRGAIRVALGENASD